ncbi:MAG TPA: RES family NAD+ phosphorylase [Candidatus Elarobacter sp.]|nr:RES family NAD+ phosphorylase [Candidatus Elarobacter sp.]
MVAPALPPPTKAVRPVWHVIRRGEELRRIWTPGGRGWRATDFRVGPPRYRFDHHDPAESRRAILYAGLSLSCCVAEKYGDFDVLEPASDRLCVLRAVEPIRVLDLRGAAAEHAGTVAGIGAFVDVAFTQAWSRYFYQTLGAEGLLYSAAHNAAPAVALYERVAAKIEAVATWPMDADELRADLLQACEENNLIFLG